MTSKPTPDMSGLQAFADKLAEAGNTPPADALAALTAQESAMLAAITDLPGVNSVTFASEDAGAAAVAYAEQTGTPSYLPDTTHGMTEMTMAVTTPAPAEVTRKFFGKDYRRTVRYLAAVEAKGVDTTALRAAFAAMFATDYADNGHTAPKNPFKADAFLGLAPAPVPASADADLADLAAALKPTTED
jgi:hypothetical protein